jgi:putative NADH-flavin reductase
MISMSEFHKIAVIGGSGKAGQYLINELVNRGFEIRALVRNPGKLAVKNPLLTKVQGDVRNYEDVVNLIAGCDAVLSTLGQPKKETPVFSNAIQNIIKAMNGAGLKRYIAITGLTIDVPGDRKSGRTKMLSWFMRTSFPAIIRDKQLEYSLLDQSDLNWTLFRLPMIELSCPAGDVKVNLYDCPGKMISASDLARFIVDQLTGDNYINQAPFLAN